MKKPKYVYCVISHIDTVPQDNVRRNGLMGIHSSRRGAEEHLMSMVNDRRKMKEYAQWDMYTADVFAWNRHLDNSSVEYYSIDVIQYRMEYKIGDKVHREMIKVEKRIVIGKK